MMMAAIPRIDFAAARRDLYKKSFSHFFRAAWHVLEPSTPLEWGWHLEAMCLHAQAVMEGWAFRTGLLDSPSLGEIIQNLLINVPPGCAKSRVISVCLPAWAWTRWPATKFLAISANPRVALRDSMYCRDLIESEWYTGTFNPDWELAEDQNAKGHFRTTAGGSRMAIGVGAKITGDRVDVLLIDDPHDASEVNSDAIRKGVLDWWDLAAFNRVNDLRTSVRIGIMQRLHELDWSGHVLQQGGWEHLRIPQEFEPAEKCETCIGWKDPRSVEGELLSPDRFPPKVLQAERRRLGSAGYSGQHQQRPSPADGEKFKRSWFRYFEDGGDHFKLHLPGGGSKRILKTSCRIFATCDTAFSTKQTADYTVICIWAITPDKELLLMQVLRGRWEDPDVERAIRNVLLTKAAPYVAVERKQNGATIFQRLVREGLPIRALEADTDKITRATLAAIDMENGKVYFCAAAPWLVDFEKEILVFPNGAHDDQVDCLAYAAIEKASEFVIEVPNGPIDSVYA